MINGTCPKCSSGRVYVSRRALGDSQQTLLFRAGEFFEVVCYLCIDCRYIELYAEETSVGLFGAGREIASLVTNDRDWRRVTPEPNG